MYSFSVNKQNKKGETCISPFCVKCLQTCSISDPYTHDKPDRGMCRSCTIRATAS